MMRIEFHASRCPDCDEQMTWAGEMRSECRWCIAYGKPEEQQ